jgi:hypothetical protein
VIDVYLLPVAAFADHDDVLLFDSSVRPRTGGRPPDRPPILVDPHVCPVHEPGKCRRAFNGSVWYCIPIYPEAQTLLASLVDQYGPIEANKTYLAMRNNRQGPFAPGAKYDPDRYRAPRTEIDRRRDAARWPTLARRKRRPVPPP